MPIVTLRRVAVGIVDHFPQRFSEWGMLWPAFGMGLALLYQEQMFSTSPSFEVLARWLREDQWACLVLTCSVLRLIALTVNGTFRAFRFSPHLRALASFAGLIFWSQYCLGFTVSAIFWGGAWSGPIMYSAAALFEFANLLRSTSDVVRSRK